MLHTVQRLGTSSRCERRYTRSNLVVVILQNVEAEEDGTAALSCEVTKPDAPVTWRKGSVGLHSSDKYGMKQKGSRVELLIHKLKLEDAGDYTCDTGDQNASQMVNKFSFGEAEIGF
uniref:Ig-like domain-containing protein n=1 Tax=Callorhinchus milii TaxID=7868 RepID=A0A4W3HXD6_CALMI